MSPPSVHDLVALLLGSGNLTQKGNWFGLRQSRICANDAGLQLRGQGKARFLLRLGFPAARFPRFAVRR